MTIQQEGKEFNVEGICVPSKHYMVDTSEKIDMIIKKFISRGKYFTINRARQYGKTTTFCFLEERLSIDYLAIRMSFEGRNGWFDSFQTFNDAFCSEMKKQLIRKGRASLAQTLCESAEDNIPEDILRQRISRMCIASTLPVVLMIDEVDRATDFDVFTTFLGILRDMFLNREYGDPTFQSVILAGVHDIKNLKRKIRPDSEHAYNSPWNIAADFDVDMSFSSEEIQSMLKDYEEDRRTGMDIPSVASQIHRLTNGYPFLVSRLCKIMDESSLEWSVHGVDEAETKLLLEKNTLFDDMNKNILGNSEFKALLESILLRGVNVGYDPGNPVIDLGMMYGIQKNTEGKACVSNVIFETRITNLLISLSNTRELTERYAQDDVFVKNGKLDMDRVVSRFSAFMKSEYRDEDGSFIERQARLLFLSFLKPIINGTGHYAVEPNTRDNRRMDIVVYYGKMKFIIELKIWRGDAYEAKGYDQIAAYLDSQEEKKGWLVSFASTKSSPRNDRIFEYNGFTINETVVSYRAK